MKTVVGIETHVDDLLTDKWFEVCDKDGYLPKNEKERAEVLKEMGLTEDIAVALEQSFAYARERIVDALSKDLRDIWKRLDDIEGRLK